MSNPELRLTLDRDDHAFQSGDIVSGAVEVSVSSKCHCWALVVELEWRTEGSGAPDSGRDDRLMLFEGTWLAGDVYRYPFSFTAPSGPATYHGHLLNVDWRVHANADVVGTGKPRVEQQILLSPSEPQPPKVRRARRRFEPDPAYLAARGSDAATSNKESGVKGVSEKFITPGTATAMVGYVLLLAALLFILVGVNQAAAWTLPKTLDLNDLAILLLGVGFFSLFVWRAFPMLMAPRLDSNLLRALQGGGVRPNAARTALGAIMLAISLGVGLTFLWMSQAAILAGGAVAPWALVLLIRAVGQQKLGPVSVQIRPVTARRGEHITCEVQVGRPPPGSLPAATATLLAWETVESGLREGILTYRHMVYEKSFPLVATSSDEDNDKLTLKALLAVPDEAPVNFSSDHNELAWQAVVRVSVDGTPDLALWYPVTVRP